MTITAAADGSSLGNPGPAGWAWYVDEDTWDAGGWPQGTNNLGELTAILRLLEATAETGEELHILADSQYAINVVSKWRLGWKKRGWTKADKKPIKNLELIQEIDRAMEGRHVTFCPYCGQNLSIVQCPACSTELEVGWHFCITCGRAMDGAESAAAGGGAPPPPAPPR